MSQAKYYQASKPSNVAYVKQALELFDIVVVEVQEVSDQVHYVLVNCSEQDMLDLNGGNPQCFHLSPCPIVGNPMPVESDTRGDGWCGHCGALFVNRGPDDPDTCDSCGKSLKENHPEGPAAPKVQIFEFNRGNFRDNCGLCGCQLEQVANS